ncbi:ABC transporter permease [Natrarchaeobius chitinivorans]|uniref:ABC transporter permease n=1 Tax=Natrarchaeobius chitinivorans TaxID=1679083 RepID=A0A3N6PD51_NATCH|nr:ABC transporter permease [Natrarchaeobius chitinivorans]RQG94845.1 ABC transporter permease [Natrarchaeobius chitinivorans]
MVYGKIVSFARNGFHDGSQFHLAYKRFRSHRLGVIGLVIVIGYLFFAIAGPIIVPRDPTAMDSASRLAGPSMAHPFGTDHYGRDVFTRTVVGARASLQVAVLSVGFATIAGVTFGLVSGFFRGYVDEAIMRAVDVMLAFPSILLALVVIAILGPGLNRTILALGIAYTPLMLRITRGSALSVREEEYVTAAVAYGERSWNVMFKEMFPNLFPTVIVQATITFAFAILVEAALSYLGLSAQPPTVTWGIMISEGQEVLTVNPWMSIFPGLAIIVTVLGLTFLGIGLRDSLDAQEDGTIGGGFQ